MKKKDGSKLRKIVITSLIIMVFLSGNDSVYGCVFNGNPDGISPIPPEARLEDVSKPDHIIGTGTPESCTSEAFIAAVAEGGKIVFNGGTKPFTMTLTEQAQVYNDANEEVIIDGGGLVTLDGAGQTRLIYMNTCDKNLTWSTDHCQNQDNPRLTVQNINFSNGNASNDSEYTGGGAIWVRGGRFKVINCKFINNVCQSTGQDIGGGAIRVFSQYEGKPVYIVNSTFGGSEGLGNKGSNGGALSSIGVSWTIINSLFSYNEAVGNGGNPKKAGTPGGGSGGAIYNDGNEMTLTLMGSKIEHNQVNAHGSGIFFVTNNHTGDIKLYDSVVENNRGGSWYPVYPDISMHSDTKIKNVSRIGNGDTQGMANPTTSKVMLNDNIVELEAYLINENNYFKLRDVAALLKGKTKQFNVTWSNETNTIALSSDASYTLVGEELVVSDSYREQGYKMVIPNIIIDDMEVKLGAYLIHENNYFKLRDLAMVFDFGVEWDGIENMISINTDRGYDIP